MMIDFHCHILPGIDDGAGDWDESIEMGRWLAGQGVTGVVATPHYLEGYYTPAAEEVLAKTDELQKRLAKAGINLRVYPGCEAMITPELPELVRKGRVLTVNNGGKYLLVELPFMEIPIYTEDVLFRLRLNGITPIIAHPERNDILAADPGELVSLIRKGCLAQVNAGSFEGLYGRKAEKAAQKLARAGAVHFLGSDLHGPGLGVIPLNSVLEALAGPVKTGEMRHILRARAGEALAGSPVDPGIQEGTGQEGGLLKRIVDRLRG